MLRIITDSASELSLKEAQELNVDILCLNITLDGKTYIESKDLSKENFFELLQSTTSFPITSQPFPKQLMDILEDAKRNNDEVLGIFLSSNLSGTFNSCMMLKELVNLDNCYFIDSKSCTYGEKILVLEAVRLRSQGKKAKDIYDAINKLKERIRIIACADNLDYLYKGGSITVLTPKLGNLLKFKPLISIDNEGKVYLLSKPRGIKSAIDEIIIKVINEKKDDSLPLYALYTPLANNAHKLIEKLSNLGIEISNKCLVGAVIGSHVGFNCFGLVYVVSECKEYTN